jgi:hypothetical protein
MSSIKKKGGGTIQALIFLKLDREYIYNKLL